MSEFVTERSIKDNLSSKNAVDLSPINEYEVLLPASVKMKGFSI